ncbi:MAG: hypothetical protein QOD49_1302 [Actinomycetota bacterium]|nr:hypothetical protein [Actinomycetota bacterium]
MAGDQGLLPAIRRSIRFDVCAAQGHKAVAKRPDSSYLLGRRTRTRLKRKCPEWKRVQGSRRRPRVPA